MENWKKIHGFSEYEISDAGQIRRTYTRIIKPAPDKDGYPRVTLIDDKRMMRKLTVHKLVLNTFVRGRYDNECASHLNGIKNDNRLNNLVWESLKDNIARKKQHGTSQVGERSGIAKLKNTDVIKIRKLHKQGQTTTEISKMFNMSRPNIGYIVNRKTWTHI